MILSIKRSAILNTEFRIYMFAELRKKNFPFWQSRGTIHFRLNDEYAFMSALGSRHVKTMIARELDISPEVFQ